MVKVAKPKFLGFLKDNRALSLKISIILRFCCGRGWGVKSPLLSEISVNGENAPPLGRISRLKAGFVFHRLSTPVFIIVYIRYICVKI